jgi:hypothetical protein
LILDSNKLSGDRLNVQHEPMKQTGVYFLLTFSLFLFFSTWLWKFTR